MQNMNIECPYAPSIQRPDYTAIYTIYSSNYRPKEILDHCKWIMLYAVWWLLIIYNFRIVLERHETPQIIIQATNIEHRTLRFLDLKISEAAAARKVLESWALGIIESKGEFDLTV